jgi:hypothetical protein
MDAAAASGGGGSAVHDSRSQGGAGSAAAEAAANQESVARDALYSFNEAELEGVRNAKPWTTE